MTAFPCSPMLAQIAGLGLLSLFIAVAGGSPMAVLLGLAAFLSTLFTLPRLGAALSGEEGVTLLGVLQNLGINVAGLIAIFFLWRRDQEGEAKEIDTLTVEETLSRLPVAVGSGGSNERIVQLCDLRSNARPVVLAGSDKSVRAAVAAAGKYKAKLEERGLVLVPFVIGSSTALEEQQRKGFGAKAKKLTERVAPRGPAGGALLPS